jgi:hypothetical protein
MLWSQLEIRALQSPPPSASSSNDVPDFTYRSSKPSCFADLGPVSLFFISQMELLFSASYYGNYVKCVLSTVHGLLCAEGLMFSSYNTFYSLISVAAICLCTLSTETLSSHWHSENLILCDRIFLILKLFWSIISGSVALCFHFNARY